MAKLIYDCDFGIMTQKADKILHLLSFECIQIDRVFRAVRWGCDREGVLFANYDYLMRITQLSKPVVVKAVALLKDYGLVEVKKRGRLGTMFRLNPDAYSVKARLARPVSHVVEEGTGLIKDVVLGKTGEESNALRKLKEAYCGEPLKLPEGFAELDKEFKNHTMTGGIGF